MEIYPLAVHFSFDRPMISNMKSSFIAINQLMYYVSSQKLL